MRRITRAPGAILGLWVGMAAAAPQAPLPTIATIDFFGLRQLSEAEVRKQLPFKEGDLLVEKERRPDGAAIAQALGVSKVTLAYICCTPDQKVMVYVGVAEKPARQVRTPPQLNGTARLPEDLVLAYGEYGTQVREAIQHGQAREDHSQGHALNDYPPLRAIQQKFIDYAREHAAQLSEVLTTSADAQHRALAAIVLGYAPDKRAAAGALATGVSDPAEDVRNNATRALGVIAGYSVAHPELGIQVDPEPFVGMLNSVVWTDLNKGLMVLTQLSAARDPKLLAQLRERARPALEDMCRWKNAGHGMQACLLLRRVDGKPE